jgi:hypothetical protein
MNPNSLLGNLARFNLASKKPRSRLIYKNDPNLKFKLAHYPLFGKLDLVCQQGLDLILFDILEHFTQHIHTVL